MSPLLKAISAPSDPFDPHDSSGTTTNDDDTDDDCNKRNNWPWRVAKYMVPVQMALVAVFCMIYFMEPHCCDNVNNFSMTFTPQLRYVKGPPPI